MRFLDTPTSAGTPPEVVIFSDRAVACCAAEALHHGPDETGGLLLGHRCGPVWYVVETVDPGPDSVHQRTFFSYDQDYVNHLMNKLRWYYQKPLELLGLWHRHPGSLDSFSGTDRGTNQRFLALYPQGVLSAILNIDPGMRMTLYAITDPQRETRVPLVWGDRFFPPPLLALRAQPATGDLRPLLNQALGASALMPGCTLAAPDVELLLGQSEADLAFLSHFCGALSFHLSGNRLELWETDGAGKRVLFSFLGGEQESLLVFNERLYPYFPGFLQLRLTAYYKARAQGQGGRLSGAGLPDPSRGGTLV